MAREIVIEIKDKVDNSVVGKIKQLAENSKIAHNSIERLKRTLEGIEPSTAKLARATSQLNNSQARQTTAQAKLKAALDKTALANQRLATETQRTAAAQKRAELATLRLSNAQERATRTSKGWASSFAVLRNALFSVFSAGLILAGPIKLANDYVILENKLKGVGYEGENLNNTLQTLYKVSNDTRSSLSSNIALYSKLTANTKELGVSQEELIDFTTNLNKVIGISGATATEADAGILQLSQGMASGRLQGQELASVLTNLPTVADRIATSMGKSRGQLRALGAEGKITAKEVLKAFESLDAETLNKFDKQTKTLGQSFEILKNNLTVILGRDGKGLIHQVVGAVDDLSFILTEADKGGATGFLTGAMENLVKVARSVGVIFGSVFLNLGSMLKGLLGNVYILGGTIVGVFKDIAQSIFDIIDLLPEALKPDNFSAFSKSTIQTMSETYKKLKAQGAEYRADGVAADERMTEKLKEIWTSVPAQPSAGTTSGGRTGPPMGGTGGSALEEEVKLKFTITRTPWKIADSYSLIQKELADIEAQQQKNLGSSSKELEINAKLAEYAERMSATKGSELDIELLRERVGLLQEQADANQRQAQILDQIQAKNAFGQSLNDVGNLIDSKKLTKEQGSDYLVGANPELFKGTQNELDANTRKYETMYAQLEELRDKDFISEEDYSKARTNLWLKQNETLLDQTEGTFANLAKLQQSSNKKIAAIGKVAANFQVAMNGIRAISEAWASGPWPYNVPAVTMATSAFAIQEAQLNGLLGFKTGGYTGNAGISDVAGVVHGKEFVFDASSVQRIGVDNLETLRSGKTGSQGGSGAMGNTYVYQYNDYVQGGTEAEREGRFTQFKRAMQSAENDRSGARAQVTL